jgi:hypothetical protein
MRLTPRPQLSRAEHNLSPSLATFLPQSIEPSLLRQPRLERNLVPGFARTELISSLAHESEGGVGRENDDGVPWEFVGTEHVDDR